MLEEELDETNQRAIAVSSDHYEISKVEREAEREMSDAIAEMREQIAALKRAKHATGGELQLTKTRTRIMEEKLDNEVVELAAQDEEAQYRYGDAQQRQMTEKQRLEKAIERGLHAKDKEPDDEVGQPAKVKFEDDEQNEKKGKKKGGAKKKGKK